MHTDADRRRVRDLLERGYTDRDVAERTGVSRNTVGRWRRGGPPVSVRWRPGHLPSYVYLLGLYLGDGCVTVNRRGGVMLRICLGTEYPGIIDDCWAALVLSMPECHPRVAPLAGIETVHVQVNGKLWLHAFPQHGPGRKHERTIALRTGSRRSSTGTPTSSCAA